MNTTEEIAAAAAMRVVGYPQHHQIKKIILEALAATESPLRAEIDALKLSLADQQRWLAESEADKVKLVAELDRAKTERGGWAHSSENWELMHAKAQEQLAAERARADKAEREANKLDDKLFHAEAACAAMKASIGAKMEGCDPVRYILGCMFRENTIRDYFSNLAESSQPGAGEALLERLGKAEARLEAVWDNCKVIYWPKNEPNAYPLEHSAAARKDMRALIEGHLDSAQAEAREEKPEHPVPSRKPGQESIGEA
jgi:hypothetical protein